MNSFINIQVRILAQQAMAQVANIQNGLQGVSNSFGKGGGAVNNFRNSLVNVSANMTKFGSQVQWTGRQIEYNFTLPIVAAGTAAMKFSLDNEAAMTRVVKVYGDGTQSAEAMQNEIHSLSGAFEELSNQYGINRAQVINIAADWAAAGASGLALAKVTEQTLKTMVLGELDATKATEALIAIQAQYNLSTKELADTIDMLNMIENQTGISMAGLIDGFSRAAGVARAAGVDTRHLGAMLAALVPTTGSAAQAGNALKTIFSRLLSTTNEARQVLGLMNINVDALQWKSSSATDRLKILTDAFNKLSSSQKAVASSVIASRYQINKFEVLMKDLSSETGFYAKALKSTENEQAVFNQAQKELNTVLQSNPRRLQVIWTMLQNALADTIQPMIPFILSLAAAVAKLMQKFSELNPGVQKLVVGFLFFLAAIGPVLRYIGATFLLLGSLGRAIVFVLGPLGALGGLLWTLVKIPLLAFLGGFGQTMALVFRASTAGLGALVGVFRTGVVTLIAIWDMLPTAMLVGMPATWGPITRAFANGLAYLRGITLVSISIIRATFASGMAPLATIVSTAWAAITRATVAGWQTIYGVSFLALGNIGRILTGFASALVVVPAAIADIMAVALMRFWQGAFAIVQVTGPFVAMLMTRLTAGMNTAILIADRVAVLMRTAWVAGLAAMQAATAAAMTGLRTIMWTGTAIIYRGMAALQAAMAIRWNAFAAGLAVAWSFTWRNIVLFFSRIPVIMREIMTAIEVALTGPWGAALVAVVLLVVAFWDQLKALWNALVTGTIRAFNALPAGIRNALMAVVNTVRAAAMAVYHLFSWMNPWAHHSPSLVENVTTGVAEIKSQFATLGDIGSIFLQAGMDLEEFGAHVRKLQAAADAKKWAELRKELSSVAPDAIPSFDKLVTVLGPLKDLLQSVNVEMRAQQAVVDGLKPGLDAANQKYDEQKAILDQLEKVASGYQDQLNAAKSKLSDFASAPIKGMKAMGDAIFNNSMEQKRLQLQLMQMEDAVGPMDKLKGRLDAINGQMELLSGEQTNLRNAGAGSEILNQYDQQIGALEDQQKAINDQVKPLQDLSDAIDALGRKGQELDLENSLQFDPLKKQIDDVANAMNELPFDEILAGVTDQRNAVDDLTQKYNDAQKAVDQQTAVVQQLDDARSALQRQYDIESDKLDAIKDKYQQVEDRIRSIEQAFQDLGQAASDASGKLTPGAENFLGAAGGNFPDPGGMGGVGREGDLPDQSALIDQFTKDLADKTKNMFGLFDFLDPIKKGWNTAMKWLSDNLGPSFAAFGSAFTGIFSKMPNPFDGAKSWLDTGKTILDDIGGFFKDLWKLIGPPVMDLLTNTWDGLKSAFASIQPEIAKFKDLVGPAGEAIKNIWIILKPVLGVILGLIGLILSALIGAIAGGIKPFIEAIGGIIAGIIRVIRGIVEFLVGVFTGDWGKAWQGIKDIFLGLWDAIWSALKGIVLTIWGLIKGLVEGIWNFFKWLWDELVGHSIIPDMINGIASWFNKMVEFAKLPFKLLKDLIFEAIDLIKDKFNQWIDRFNWVKGQIGLVIDWLKGRFWETVNTWIDVYNNIRGWIDTFVNKFNEIKNRFSFWGLFDGIKDAFKSAINWVIDKWNSLHFGIGGIDIGTPNIQKLAKGGVTSGVAIVGEGRPQYPEYVIPTDPSYRKRAVQLFADLGKQLGIGKSQQGALLASIVAGQKRGAFGQKVQMFASGGVVGQRFKFRGLGGTAVVIAPSTTYREIHFHGDLTFPNVKDGSDAETFIRNLEALMDGE